MSNKSGVITKELVEQYKQSHKLISTYAVEIITKYSEMYKKYVDARIKEVSKKSNNSIELSILEDMNSSYISNQSSFHFFVFDELDEDDEICFHMDCDNDVVYYLPVQYLYDPEWEKTALTDIKEKVDSEINRIIDQKEEFNKQKEEYEKEQLKQLIVKYGLPKPC